MSREFRRKQRESEIARKFENPQIDHEKENISKELEEMFDQTPFWDRIKLQYAVNRYNKESPRYKMIFDHKFRYERYKFITSHSRRTKGRSKFRSLVYSKYNDFPIECIHYMNFVGTAADDPSDNNDKESSKIPESVDNHFENPSEPNILIRDKLLKSFSRMHKLELLCKFINLGFFGFMFACIPMQKLNRKAFLSISIPVVVINLFSLGLRVIKGEEYNNLIDEHYFEQAQAYEYLFCEERYE
ncbi:unnamed protein product [Moneuplotes crassus]|uniref:Uncharacterized protein n=1 Tax=Euplotes crassus TaxID=5936 RepID=A0AAD1XWA7_EUPCR|nr:unnamed protein product [Moneuplotes crassus]